MDNEFNKLKYEFILKILSILEKYGGLVLPGINYPDRRPMEVLPDKDKNDTSHIAKLTDELINTLNDFLAKAEQPILTYFDQKKEKASFNHRILSVPRCFGMEHSDDRRCQICSFEFDCERTIFN